MTKKEFKKWVDKTVREYNADFKVLCLYRGETGEIIDENKIIVLDAKTGKTGMSKCHKDDKFIFETGLAIAYARLRGIEVPKVEGEPKFERVRVDEKYWYICFCGGRAAFFAESENHLTIDDHYFNNNNYFHTQKRAKEVADKINFLLKLERLHDIYCPDYKPDWNNNREEKYCVYFDYDKNKYNFDFCTIWENKTQAYFPTEEIAQKVCDELNKELKMSF